MDFFFYYFANSRGLLFKTNAANIENNDYRIMRQNNYTNFSTTKHA